MEKKKLLQPKKLGRGKASFSQKHTHSQQKKMLEAFKKEIGLSNLGLVMLLSEIDSRFKYTYDLNNKSKEAPIYHQK